MVIVNIDGHIMDALEVKISDKGTVWFPFRLKHSEMGNDEKEHNLIVNCVAFGMCAQSMYQTLQKDSAVIIHGKLQTKKYVDKEGKGKERTTILVENYELPGKWHKRENVG